MSGLLPVFVGLSFVFVCRGDIPKLCWRLTSEELMSSCSPSKIASSEFRGGGLGCRVEGLGGLGLRGLGVQAGQRFGFKA